MNPPGRKHKAPQLDLFAPDDVDPPLPFDEERALAARLPQTLRLGTSSWTFPGWAGIVYPGHPTTRDLVERGLSLYARNPLFRVVGVDRFFYDLPAPDDIGAIARQMPPDLRCVIKAWSGFTAPVFPQTDRPSPAFLDPEQFLARMLEPCRPLLDRSIFLLEFPAQPDPYRVSIDDLTARLDRFLGAMPAGARFAVELRERRLLTGAYLDVLARHRASHTLNYWERMPDLGAQLAMKKTLTAPFVVCRLVIRPGAAHDVQKAKFEPFHRLVEPDVKMRADVAALVERCLAEERELYVLANNKAEGCSPLTIKELARLLAR